ncbi:hypothetical protein F2P81_006411 [Scophthalmus maximus]|uniref:C2H2-type domain-containing protein n=1 Tax=Scophthalmus maximus TaxID=52904 RepID=A0A6A4T354_SCOMX|nr:hypothetical protein F2P81_006411 [Scophthalmus maximus]
MAWKCKLCAAVFDKSAQLLEHYRLQHSNVSSVSPLPCLYDDCIYTFQSVNALKIHLTRLYRLHSQTPEPNENQVCAEFHRIANINLKNHFYAEFDRHAPRLQSLFRKKAARTGKVADVLGQLFRTYDLQASAMCLFCVFITLGKIKIGVTDVTRIHDDGFSRSAKSSTSRVTEQVHVYLRVCGACLFLRVFVQMSVEECQNAVAFGKHGKVPEGKAVLDKSKVDGIETYIMRCGTLDGWTLVEKAKVKKAFINHCRIRATKN